MFHDQDVCIDCNYHENIDLILLGLAKLIPGIPNSSGVFVSLYARCLVSKGLMIKQVDIPDFRKSMILELHEKKLTPIPAEPIKPNEYYAVDYINNYNFQLVEF